mgnify:CR=1 FL=1
MSPVSARPGRVRRLAEELAELGLDLDGPESWRELLLGEIDYAMHPAVHERRVPSYGCMVEPTAPPEVWAGATDLGVTRRGVGAVDGLRLQGRRGAGPGVTGRRHGHDADGQGRRQPARGRRSQAAGGRCGR